MHPVVGQNAVCGQVTVKRPAACCGFGGHCCTVGQCGGALSIGCAAPTAACGGHCWTVGQLGGALRGAIACAAPPPPPQGGETTVGQIVEQVMSVTPGGRCGGQGGETSVGQSVEQVRPVNAASAC